MLPFLAPAPVNISRDIHLRPARNRQPKRARSECYNMSQLGPFYTVLRTLTRPPESKSNKGNSKIAFNPLFKPRRKTRDDISLKCLFHHGIVALNQMYRFRCECFHLKYSFGFRWPLRVATAVSTCVNSFQKWCRFVIGVTIICHIQLVDR